MSGLQMISKHPAVICPDRVWNWTHCESSPVPIDSITCLLTDSEKLIAPNKSLNWG